MRKIAAGSLVNDVNLSEYRLARDAAIRLMRHYEQLGQFARSEEVLSGKIDRMTRSRGMVRSISARKRLWIGRSLAGPGRPVCLLRPVVFAPRYRTKVTRHPEEGAPSVVECCIQVGDLAFRGGFHARI